MRSPSKIAWCLRDRERAKKMANWEEHLEIHAHGGGECCLYGSQVQGGGAKEGATATSASFKPSQRVDTWRNPGVRGGFVRHAGGAGCLSFAQTGVSQGLGSVTSTVP